MSQFLLSPSLHLCFILVSLHYPCPSAAWATHSPLNNNVSFQRYLLYLQVLSCALQGTVTSTSSLFSKLPAVSLGFSQTPPANLPSIFLPHHLPLAKKLLPGSLNTTKCVFTTLRKKNKTKQKTSPFYDTTNLFVFMISAIPACVWKPTQNHISPVCVATSL